MAWGVLKLGEPPLIMLKPSYFHKGQRAIVLELDDRTTAANLRALIPEALAWRDRLRDVQGPDTDRVEGLREIWLRRREAGEGPTKLAREVNKQLAEQVRFAASGDYFAVVYACAVLSEVLGGDVAYKEIDRAVARVRAGGNPFPPDCPVSPERMRTALNTWRDSPLRGGRLTVEK